MSDLQKDFENYKIKILKNKNASALEEFLYMPFILFDILNETIDEENICHITIEDICKRLNRSSNSIYKLINNINGNENVIECGHNKIKLNIQDYTKTIYGKETAIIFTMFVKLPSTLDLKNKEIIELTGINNEKLIHTIRTLYKTKIRQDIKAFEKSQSHK